MPLYLKKVAKRTPHTLFRGGDSKRATTTIIVSSWLMWDSNAATATGNSLEKDLEDDSARAGAWTV